MLLRMASGKWVLLALLCAGCTTRTITLPNGIMYKSQRFANKEQIGKIVFHYGTNTLEIYNFQSDQVQAIGVVAEGIAKGVASGLKP